MISELRTASRVICQRLRQRPYQRGVTITAWEAVIDQLMDDRRCGAFSWQNALGTEVRRYIAEMSEEAKRRIWDASEDAKVIPNASLETITLGLYALVYQGTLPRIHRTVRNRRRREIEAAEAEVRREPRRSRSRRPTAAAGPEGEPFP